MAWTDERHIMRERCGSTSCHNRKMLSALVTESAACGYLTAEQYKITQKHTAACSAATEIITTRAHTQYVHKETGSMGQVWLVGGAGSAAGQGNNGRSLARTRPLCWKKAHTYERRARFSDTERPARMILAKLN
jgi:hypothetical protein